MHAIVYNKSPSLLINPACCGDSVCVRRPRVPLIVFPGPTGRFATGSHFSSLLIFMLCEEERNSPTKSICKACISFQERGMLLKCSIYT